MIFIYRILFLPILLVALPFYLKRMFRRGGYLKNFHHRFGLAGKLPKKDPSTRRIWIQAVSVGELHAIAPILENLIQHPDVEIVLTTTTSTAHRIALELYEGRVQHVGVFPLDFWPFSFLSWLAFKPDLVVLMESELWPEHVHQAKSRRVPVYLINARLSDRSFARYKKLKFFARFLLSKIDFLLASSAQDFQRFKNLGFPEDRMLLAGNLKFDVAVKPLLLADQKVGLRQELGFSKDGLILLGSSTWPTEEALLLDVHAKLREGGLACHLLLVPRHMERRDEIVALLEKQKLSWHMRSVSKQAPVATDIYLADTTGELVRLSQIADLVFVGNSLPPNEGGQTPIEAAALGLPIVYGPNMSNFKQISTSLKQTGAACCVKNAQEAKQMLEELAHSPQRRKALGEAASVWHKSNQGAADRVLEAIYQALGL